jgi:plastocyanin
MRVRRTLWIVVCAVICGGLFGASALADDTSGATVSGRVLAPGVVWVDDGNAPAPISAEMRNVDKSFVPDVLAVPVGSTVRFPNDDPFFHSIYSISAPNDFDIGFYSTGPGKDETFTTAGIVDVHCHIHAHMHATIVVVSGPFEKVDGQTFSLPSVRPGTHVLYAWSPADGIRSTVIRVPRDGELTLSRAL